MASMSSRDNGDDAAFENRIWVIGDPETEGLSEMFSFNLCDSAR
jgi:hypothetical protein